MQVGEHHGLNRGSIQFPRLQAVYVRYLRGAASKVVDWHLAQQNGWEVVTRLKIDDTLRTKLTGKDTDARR